ncbi:MAG: Crp/Fnr family transcriptional regulator [Streptosporangiaceae bacterium]
MAPDVAGVLRRTALLATAPEDEIAALAAAARLRTFRRGQVVCTVADPGVTLMVVITGRLKVVVRSADGGELTLTSVGPAGLVGEVSVADGGPRSADVEAIEDSDVLLVPRAPVQDLCGRVPSVALALAASVAGTLRRLTEATSDLVFLDLPRRVAKMLLTQPTDDAGRIQPPVPQGELARQIGGTRQSVNAALRAFERRGWIEMAGRSLTLRDPGELARFAGELPP